MLYWELDMYQQRTEDFHMHSKTTQTLEWSWHFFFLPMLVFIYVFILFKQVLSLIKGCPYQQGISIQELKQKLSGISLAVIKWVLHEILF